VAADVRGLNPRVLVAADVRDVAADVRRLHLVPCDLAMLPNAERKSEPRDLGCYDEL
jgi:hypothetical protein